MLTKRVVARRAGGIAGDQVDLHRAGRGGVGGGVGAAAAVDHVVAVAALQHVVAGRAGEGQQADVGIGDDRARAAGVVGVDGDPAVAVERVVAAAAAQAVVAEIAGEQIVVAVAGQDVVERRAGQILEAGERSSSPARCPAPRPGGAATR